MSVDLAQMELEHYKLRRSSMSKVRKAFEEKRFEGKGKRRHSSDDRSNPTLFSTALYMFQVGKEVDRKSKKATLMRNTKIAEAKDLMTSAG